MFSFIMAIPPELNGLWWVYDLMLIAVIVVSIIILGLFKKRSPEKDANKLVKRAEKYLERASVGHLRAIINMKTAKNILSSASYYYKEAVKEKEIYKLRLKIAVIEELLLEIDALTSQDKAEGYKEGLESVLKKLRKI